MAREDDIRGIRVKLELKLSALSQRLVEEADASDIAGAAASAIVDALAEIPGALSVAADLASSAMFRGLGATFDASADQVDAEVGGGGGQGWEYTAVMDGATCDECEAQDGTTYDTWEEIAGPDGPLPDGGPNPDCYGNGRCRCRPTLA